MQLFLILNPEAKIEENVKPVNDWQSRINELTLSSDETTKYSL